MQRLQQGVEHRACGTEASDEEESILAGAGWTVMVARLVPSVRLLEGEGVRLSVDTSRLYLFDKQGEAIQ